MSEGALQIELLGGFQIRRADRGLIRLETQKTGVLLAYLAYFSGSDHPRAELIEMLWPESDREAGQHRLRQALYALRCQLEPAEAPRGMLLAAGATIRLNPAAFTTDVAQFAAALDAAERAATNSDPEPHLVRVLELYRGPLLPGFYEDWVLRERQRREEQFFQALRGLIRHYEQAGDLHSALVAAHRAVAADPLREEAQFELIRLYAAAGRPQSALRCYRELEQVLRRELDLSPDAAARALARSIAESLEPAPASRVQDIAAVPDPPLLTSATLVGGSPDGSHQPGSTGLPHANDTDSIMGAASGYSAPAAFRPPAPAGGALALDSLFYIRRAADEQFAAAVGRGDSIVLLKGTRQVGKSSLLARGLQESRQAGARVVTTDFQGINAATLDAPEAMLRSLAQSMADQLGLPVAPGDGWLGHRGPNANFERYLERHVLDRDGAPVVWALDQVDRIFSSAAGADLFGMFRAWHNERALDPDGPWSRLTLVIAYATEAHLFIRQDDQSPFNVGTRLTLADLTREQVAELNRRSGRPLPDDAALARFWSLVGGHPYLVHRGLQEMAQRGVPLTELAEKGAGEEGIYGDHLRRLRVLLARDPGLCEAMRTVLEGRPCRTLDDFYRLRSAGAVVGESDQDARLRCLLYALYLERHLPRARPER